MCASPPGEKYFSKMTVLMNICGRISPKSNFFYIFGLPELSQSSSRPSPGSARSSQGRFWAGLGPGEGLGWLRGGSELSSTAYSDKICVFGIHPHHPWLPRICPIGCQEARLGTSLPRAPGVRMTRVLNTLPQNIKIRSNTAF